MRILVCIKQVPGTTQVEVDAETGVLKRDGVPSKLNPYDLYALEVAMTLREKHGGTVLALTMGPPQAKAVLWEALAMGADRGVLISDRAFAGSDVLATARALAEGVQVLGDFDLILCGKQTTDGDTAQVGSEMAELMGLPNVGNVLGIDAFDGSCLTVRADLDAHIATQRLPLPCVICVDGGICTPRLPSYKRMKTLTEDLLQSISLADFEAPDAKRFGMSGSPTRVERIFPPVKNTQKEMLTGSADETAAGLFAILHDRKFI